MKRFQSVALVAITAITLGSTATSSLAEKYEVVTRGPNGAGHVVKKGQVPIAAHAQPQSEARSFPNLITRGPGGASHITNNAAPKSQGGFVAFPNIVNRGPNGGGQLK